MAVVLNVHCTHLILELRSALKRSPIVQLTAVEIELHPSALAGEGVGGQEGVARVCAVWTHTSCVRATLGLATEGRPPPARPCLPRGGAVRPRTPVRCLHHGGGVRLCQQLTRRAGSRCRGDGSPTRAPSFPPSPHAQCDRERPWGGARGPACGPLERAPAHPGPGLSFPLRSLAIRLCRVSSPSPRVFLPGPFSFPDSSRRLTSRGHAPALGEPFHTPPSDLSFLPSGQRWVSSLLILLPFENLTASSRRSPLQSAAGSC